MAWLQGDILAIGAHDAPEDDAGGAAAESDGEAPEEDAGDAAAESHGEGAGDALGDNVAVADPRSPPGDDAPIADHADHCESAPDASAIVTSTADGAHAQAQSRQPTMHEFFKKRV